MGGGGGTLKKRFPLKSKQPLGQNWTCFKHEIKLPGIGFKPSCCKNFCEVVWLLALKKKKKMGRAWAWEETSFRSQMKISIRWGEFVNFFCWMRGSLFGFSLAAFLQTLQFPPISKPMGSLVINTFIHPKRFEELLGHNLSFEMICTLVDVMWLFNNNEISALQTYVKRSFGNPCYIWRAFFQNSLCPLFDQIALSTLHSCLQWVFACRICHLSQTHSPTHTHPWHTPPQHTP